MIKSKNLNNSRSEVKIEHQWDLEQIYPSIEAWSRDFEDLESTSAKISEFQGILGKSAKNLESGTCFILDIHRKLEKLYTYAHLLSDSDTTNSNYLSLLERVRNLYARIATLSSFITPEILAIEETTLNLYLQTPGLLGFTRYIKEIFRYKPHTLTKEEETVLAMSTEVLSVSYNIFSQLNDADLQFGNILIDGQDVPLTHSSYSLLLKNQDRSVRKTTFENYYKVFEQHKNTLASTFTGSLKKDSFLARVRKYQDSRSRSLFSDNIPTAVYDNLIETVSQNLQALHRYYSLRKKLLNLEPLYLYDTYVPLVDDVSVSHTYEQAVDILCESLTPLGTEYVAILKQGLTNERWVDRYENKGKRSGAYSSGSYDTYPYILLNYQDATLNSVFTLAHEAGHSLHSYYSRKYQAYQDSSYTIFVAEVASTFNEHLLSAHLKKVYRNDPRMLAYLINHQIDDIKATLYRQVMFAEFEKDVHQRIDNNQALTLKEYRSIYRALLKKYFGEALTLSELDDLECFRIPHFYSSFYVYKYAIGISASLALAKQVTSGGIEERERYLNFLKGGGSKYSLELLEDAGVDMQASRPIEIALASFATLVSELEQVLI